MQVVTYQSESGGQIHICPDCEKRLLAAGQWPKDGAGREIVNVRMGLHNGSCSVHPKSRVTDPANS